MALLGKSFDAETVAPGQPRGFEPMRPGKYQAMIINSEMRKIKPKDGEDPDGDYGQYLWLDIEIVGGDYDRRRLFENIVLEHPNPQTVEIAEQTLREVCLACGKPQIKDSEELHDIIFVVDLQVVQDRRNKNLRENQQPFPPQNRIKSYLPVEGGPAAPVQRQQGFAAGSPPNGSQGGAGGFVATGRPGGTGGAVASQRPAASNGAGGGGLPWPAR